MKYYQRLILLIIAVCTLNIIAAQTVYTCNGKYRIELPSKLELQHSELNTVNRIALQNKKPQVNVRSSSDQIIFQQKGLNANKRDAFNKYCRVLIHYYQEDRNNPAYGRGDQIFVNRDLLYMMTESTREACARNKTPLIKFFSMQPLSINGFPVLYYSYKREGWEGKMPPVIVNVYQIYNRYESITLTFSYREAEREMWKSIHNNIIKTFNFIKKY